MEGQLRCEELNQYLEKVRAEKVVWISEDATAIVPKVNYDAVTDELVGLALPLNQDNGCPVTHSFKANTADHIKENMQKKKSTLVYAVLAQPINEMLPPFILQLYGIDNTFEAKNVMNRWEHTERELEKYGIQVAGYASDADTRLMTVMCHRTQFIMNYDSKTVQDSVHIATKLRNRLLNDRISLHMGTHKVTVDHLKTLVKKVPKEVHGLSLHDACPNDRQNFASYEKIVSKRVLQALEGNVPDCQGTIKYLQICHDVTSSYMEHDLKPTDRIIRIWRAVYFCRIWREYIRSSKRHNLKTNFLTAPAYQCIEINARNMIELIRKFRDSNTPQFFIPTLFQSQTCEKIFRLFRSMGTMSFTKINFSTLELLYMVGRVEALNEIMYFKLLNSGCVFPKLEVDTRKTKIYNLPTEGELLCALRQARISAMEDARNFGMSLDEETLGNYAFHRRAFIHGVGNDDDEDSIDDDEEADDQLLIGETEEDDFISSTFQDQEEPNGIFSEDDGRNTRRLDRLFTEIITENGSKRNIRKSSLVWLLSDDYCKLSNDRLKRVQTTKANKK